VSQLLSDPLNNFSNQLFGDSGFEVGFESDSYNEWKPRWQSLKPMLNVSAQANTLNDRLTVQVG